MRPIELAAGVLLGLSAAGCTAVSPATRDSFWESQDRVGSSYSSLARTIEAAYEDGYVDPAERQAINEQLEALGVGISDGWKAIQAALESAQGFDWTTLLAALSSLILGIPISFGVVNHARDRRRQLRGEPVQVPAVHPVVAAVEVPRG